jgi:ribosomal protein S18 acetylase RimI-like enzyme
MPGFSCRCFDNQKSFAIMHIQTISPAKLDVYAAIPMTVEVKSIFRVEPVHAGLGGLQFFEEGVTPYIKDYDGYGETPRDWPQQFDVSNWGFFLANKGEQITGGAAVAFNTNGVNMLEGRSDLSVLWDIRVHPDFRSMGIGKALFWYAAEWSRQHGCRQMKIETQSVNIPACRFYASQGAVLGGINCYGYYGHPQVCDEAMLLWYLDL